MKLVIIADTHIPKKAKELPSRLLEELPTADAIIHAGDWQTLEVYEAIKTFAPVYGVHGNVDGEEIRELFPARQIIELGGKKIGLVHGHGEKKTTEKRAIEAFDGEELDLLIFGHSHIPLLRYFKKTLLFNAGSATDKRRTPFYSFGILTIEDEIRAEHIFFGK